jgi:hypothetical protein
MLSLTKKALEEFDNQDDFAYPAKLHESWQYPNKQCFQPAGQNSGSCRTI